MRLILFRDTETIEEYDNYVVVDVDDEENSDMDDLSTVHDFFEALDDNDPGVTAIQEVVNGAVVWKQGDTRSDGWVK